MHYTPKDVDGKGKSNRWNMENAASRTSEFAYLGTQFQFVVDQRIPLVDHVRHFSITAF